MKKEENFGHLNEPDNLIRFIRNQWVLLDKDLAGLYGVSTKVLNQQVKRNIERFPTNFMFKLNEDEFHELVTNCDRFKTLKHSSAMPPWAPLRCLVKSTAILSALSTWVVTPSNCVAVPI